jgi:hypothetical protein
VDNLVWVQELIEALDLEALGTVLDAQLRAYVDRGSPADERLLAERCAFEHEVRRYRARAQEPGYAKIKCLVETRYLPQDRRTDDRDRQPVTSIGRLF